VKEVEKNYIQFSAVLQDLLTTFPYHYNFLSLDIKISLVKLFSERVGIFTKTERIWFSHLCTVLNAFLSVCLSPLAYELYEGHFSACKTFFLLKLKKLSS